MGYTYCIVNVHIIEKKNAASITVYFDTTMIRKEKLTLPFSNPL